MTKCSAIEAANYLVYLMSGTVEDLTNMKLNKILYYAQGQRLLQTGEVLFDDVIEAWDHGPVVDKVYHKYKMFNNSPITEYDPSMLDSIPDDVTELLINVSREYGKYTASALRNMTHLPNGPWSRVYTEGQQHTAIPVDLIKTYFEAHEKAVGEIQMTFTSDDFVGHRDSEGVLVLPKEWDDEAV